MAKRYEVWEVRWTRCEYGGPSVAAQPSYHMTRESAVSYKANREGDGSVRPPDDPFYDVGSEPSLKLVGKAEFRRLNLSNG